MTVTKRITKVVKSKGFIYCLTNPSFKANIYKVGFTVNDPSLRADQLYKTGVPTPFKILFAKEVEDYQQKEHLLHQIMEACGKRVNTQREFFECDASIIKNLFKLIDGTWHETVDQDKDANKINTNTVDKSNVKNTCALKRKRESPRLAEKRQI